MAKRVVRSIRIEGNIAYVPLTRGYEAIIDADDIHLVEGFDWFASGKRRPDGVLCNIYARRDASQRNGAPKRSVFLHRVIAGTPDGLQTDHIDGDGLNNRRENLRVASPSQNGRNQRLSVANTSGVKGVCWHKRYGKWMVQITVNGQNKCLGYYANIDSAATAYAQASEKLHGEFGRLA